MKRILLACVATSMLGLSGAAVAADNGFTINPLVGASNSKHGGTNAAVGLEGGYNNFLLGYTYTGDDNKTSFTDVENGEALGTVVHTTVYAKDKYKAHSLYTGYQFDLGSAQLAFKAGVEMSKYSLGAGVGQKHYEINGNFIDQDDTSVSGKSSYKYAPMVGVGYYLDNGLNFNLHYTWQKGEREMKYSADSKFVGKSKDVSNKDFSAFMFTVGYRF
ncbi:hypothetical protein [Shewanella violacea]|uniref:Outer membrane protein beta-barrel domain-containing protein n=1 Tax=Shewanella violacea (strain JCM 10179 / CIP 106290 / LMG 19151 / DSS12) TaxID=637905 RepID=D4ZJT1_SHEVD|nr:hypothetical protein [Shewanella violacea]BAJ01930.1 hypothetical protein SVI_1959 [Shewanella violacea DSS12]